MVFCGTVFYQMMHKSSEWVLQKKFLEFRHWEMKKKRMSEIFVWQFAWVAKSEKYMWVLETLIVFYGFFFKYSLCLPGWLSSPLSLNGAVKTLTQCATNKPELTPETQCNYNFCISSSRCKVELISQEMRKKALVL